MMSQEKNPVAEALPKEVLPGYWVAALVQPGAKLICLDDPSWTACSWPGARRLITGIKGHFEKKYLPSSSSNSSFSVR
jgi:hypothetical protein